MRTETAILHTVGLQKVRTVNHKDGDMLDCENQPHQSQKNISKERYSIAQNLVLSKNGFLSSTETRNHQQRYLDLYR